MQGGVLRECLCTGSNILYYVAGGGEFGLMTSDFLKLLWLWHDLMIWATDKSLWCWRMNMTKSNILLWDVVQGLRVLMSLSSQTHPNKFLGSFIIFCSVLDPHTPKRCNVQSNLSVISLDDVSVLYQVTAMLCRRRWKYWITDPNLWKNVKINIRAVIFLLLCLLSYCNGDPCMKSLRGFYGIIKEISLWVVTQCPLLLS